MTTTPYLIPEFRGLTIVGTALSRDASGTMAHRITTDTTLPDAVEVVYQVTG